MQRVIPFIMGFIYDGEEEPVDEVMVSVMKAPKKLYGRRYSGNQLSWRNIGNKPYFGNCTFTWSKTCRTGRIYQTCFLNGRVICPKAEAVMDVIQSDNELALKSSFHQLKRCCFFQGERASGKDFI